MDEYSSEHHGETLHLAWKTIRANLWNAAASSNKQSTLCDLCGSPVIQRTYDVCTNENCPGYES